MPQPFLWLLLAAAPLAIFAAALPKDMSIAAYKRFNESLDQEIKKTIVEEFADREARIQQLSEPFQLGDEVTIRIIQGSRVRNVTGTFKGVTANLAQIGERRIRLTDIDELDRDRLFFGQNKQMLRLKLNQLRKTLEEEKTRRQASLRELKLQESGYTEEFFSQVEELGDRYWLYSELGDRRISLQLVVSEVMDFVDAELTNRTNLGSDFLLLLDKKGLVSSLEVNDGQLVLRDRVWHKFRFHLDKSDLGEDPAATVARTMRLWIIKDGVGNWFLKPQREERANVVKLQTRPCPECLKAREVPKVVDGEAVAGQTMPCPSCEGSGEIETEEPYAVRTYNFEMRLIKSSVKGFGGSLVKQLPSHIEEAQVYKDGIEGKIEAGKQATREARVAREMAKREEDAAAREEEAAREAAQKRAAALEEAMGWMQPNADGIDKYRAKLHGVHFLSSNVFDDLSVPRRLDQDTPIRRCSAWSKGTVPERTKGFDLFNPEYRILQLGEEGNLSYQLQYVVFCSTKFRAAHVVPRATVTFTDGSSFSWENEFEVPLSWAGVLTGIHEVPIDKLELGIHNVHIEHLEQ